MVCINKGDINPENTTRIRQYCEKNGIRMVGEIPYDRTVIKAMVAEKAVVEFDAGPAATEIKKTVEKGCALSFATITLSERINHTRKIIPWRP